MKTWRTCHFFSFVRCFKVASSRNDREDEEQRIPWLFLPEKLSTIPPPHPRASKRLDAHWLRFYSAADLAALPRPKKSLHLPSATREVSCTLEALGSWVWQLSGGLQRCCTCSRSPACTPTNIMRTLGPSLHPHGDPLQILFSPSACSLWTSCAVVAHGRTQHRWKLVQVFSNWIGVVNQSINQYLL